MADGDELPDADYESIYGADALEARRRARADAQIARLDALIARQEALNASVRQRLDATQDHRRDNGA